MLHRFLREDNFHGRREEQSFRVRQVIGKTDGSLSARPSDSLDTRVYRWTGMFQFDFFYPTFKTISRV